MESQTKRDPYKLVGTSLDRYEIQELVGIGGMGAVYRAQHDITKAKVAIKVLRPDLAAVEELGVSLFFEEASKIVSLNHPSIIKVAHADYTADGAAYMVMEWIDGRTLEEELQEIGPLSLQKTAQLLDPIADAVAYAHRKGVIHRDLKPSNIMLVRSESDDNLIRVLDFGIAKVLSANVGINTRVAGTSFYISPEQTIPHSPIDQGADIYSLGIILYQMLTGRVPFNAESETQVMDMHRSVDPRPLRQLQPEIPQAVEDVVLRAMAKKPADRYRTATDLSRAFRWAANLEPSELELQCLDAVSGVVISGAEIFLNGKTAGKTDESGYWRQAEVMPRQYLIEIESHRYTSWNRSIELESNEELTVVAKLERQPIGELIIACRTPNVEVEVDGKPMGKTDQTGRLFIDSLPAGQRQIRLTHPKYHAVETSVTVDVWQQAHASLQMTERPQVDPIKIATQKISSLLNMKRGSATPEPTPQNEGLIPPAPRDPLPRIGDRPSFDRGRVRALPPAPEPTPEQIFSPRLESFIPPSGSGELCPRCYAEAEPGLKFCTQCGTRLTGSSTNEFGSLEVPGVPAAFLAQNFDVNETPSPGGALAIIPPNLEPEAAPEIAKSSWTDDPILVIASGVLVLLFIGIVVWWSFYRQPSFSQTFSVSPPGSRILIDARPEITVDQRGLAVIEDLSRGEHQIRISHPGFADIIETVSLPLSKPLSQFVLKPSGPPGMVFIPGGTFMMGSGAGDADNPAGPPHQTTVKAFFLDQYEVTHEAYWKSQSLSEERRKMPLTGATWKEANTYCRSIGKRLPTEAEWEFAARGSDNRLYPWGDKFEDGRANTAGANKDFTVVGRFPEGVSPFGVYDLSGNAWEWTDTDFASYPGSSYLPRSCQPACKVIRGGAYDSKPDFATAVYRVPYEPTGQDRSVYLNTGFRCAQDKTP